MSANIGGFFSKPQEGVSPCIQETTRTNLIALRNDGNLDPNCHYTITNPSADGTLDVQKITLHAVDANTLGQDADIWTSHDNTAWSGTYDIDQNDVLKVTDNLENTVIANDAIITFPWGVATVQDNHVNDGRVVYNGGTMDGNHLGPNSNLTLNGGTFNNNVIATDSNVTANGNVQRNHFEAQSNTTISAGDFLENRVESDATVNSSTTGDVDNNNFSSLSVSNISGTANVDTVIVSQNANLTVSGGSLSDSSIQEDAQVTIINNSNYENVFGASTIYNQVGTGYIRYSTIEGTTTWTNGNTNISNVQSYTSTVNTTGSTGTISNSDLNRAYLQNTQNIPSLTITDCSITDYTQISANGATRLYLYRSQIESGGRILLSAGTRLDSSYCSVSDYGYFQVLDGRLTVNYSTIDSLGYIQNNTTGFNTVDRVSVHSQAKIRFLNSANNCRVYYSEVSSGANIEHRGSSSNCYIYYCNVSSLGEIYTDSSTNGRQYYCNADSRGRVYSQGNTRTHYQYYCNASSAGQVIMINNTGSMRQYSIDSTSQSIARLQNSTSNGNWYYSSFTSYYYAYITRNGGTNSGLFGQGRRSYTVTNPVGVTPYNSGSSWQNF